ncbi:MAG: hypothetical protein ABIR57_09505, partial [Aeromicrobium sp.]
KVSTGAVVGETRISDQKIPDTEALSIDGKGNLWIADTGDNLGVRHDIALYALPEPGVGNHSVKATRYPLAYADGPHNVEALLINRVTGDKYLATKAMPAGNLVPIPRILSTSKPNTLTVSDVVLPPIVTDGAITADGRFAIIRTYVAMSVYDVKTWKLRRTTFLPPQKQGETLAGEPGGKTVLIGSEGKHSQLLRVALDTSQAPVPTETPSTTATPSPSAEKSTESGRSRTNWWIAGGAGVVLVAAGGLVTRRRR